VLTEIQILTLFACFTIGAILRTLWGALWKIYEEPDMEWDHKYTVTMVASIALTLIFAVTTFASVPMPETMLSIHAFGYMAIGFTTNTLFNSVVSAATRGDEP